jgi:hypothetical protein
MDETGNPPHPHIQSYSPRPSQTAQIGTSVCDGELPETRFPSDAGRASVPSPNRAPDQEENT